MNTYKLFVFFEEKYFRLKNQYYEEENIGGKDAQKCAAKMCCAKKCCAKNVLMKNMKNIVSKNLASVKIVKTFFI